MKFLLTRELGRLAKWLRILGFDAEYFTAQKSSSLIIAALRDERIILTRNLRLPEMHGIKTLYIKSDYIREQISQVCRELNISADSSRMFSRCILCNLELVGIEKEKIKDKVPEYVFKTQDNFVCCPQCQRVYWQGTHWGNAAQILREIA
jgi:hypothetical protein